MLAAYTRHDDQLAPLPDLSAIAPGEAVWIDLHNATAEEDAAVERLLGISVPTRAEMEEIEPSARLYSEDGAEFMTMTALTMLDGDQPQKTPVTFILSGSTLVTVRYAEPKPFARYTRRALRPKTVACNSGEQVMLGLLEAFVDRLADTIERSGDEIDAVSREVFHGKDTKVNRKTRNLQSLIERVGARAEILTMVQESLVSIARVAAYHAALEKSQNRSSKESREIVRMIQRDATSLVDHARALSNRINFLLDATLGLINLEQNQIIKIFSVAAVVFLPPTLVASIYGMNFNSMPELNLPYGYPLALGLMVISALLPYLFFKRRGWL